MGNNPLRRPFEVLVRFSLDVQPVRASRLREIFGPVATPTWKFSTNVGSLRRYCFPFFHLLLTVLWIKLSTWTVVVATVALPYNDWSDSAPAYNPGRFYAS